MLAAAVVGSTVLTGTSGTANAAGGNDDYVFERRAPESNIYFKGANDVAVNEEGTVFVADSGNELIRVFDPTGQELAEWDTNSVPKLVTISADGYLYVAYDNHRVHKVSVDEEYNFTVVNEWDGAEQFDSISGIAVHDESGDVLLTDSSLNRIWVLLDVEVDDPNRIQFTSSYFGSDGPQNFESPKDIVFGNDGQLYIAESTSRILVIDMDGMLVDEWENGQAGSTVEIDSIKNIAFGGEGHLYVTDEDGDQLIRFGEDWESIAIGSEGIASGQFDSPRGVAVSSDGLVYVVDGYNDRIQQFNAELESLDSWGSFGDELGKFYYPDHVAIDKDGFVYVADTGNQRVQKFDSDLNFVQAQGGGNNFYPTGVAVDSDSNVYISDTYNLYKYAAASGDLLPFYTYLNDPRDIEIDSNNHVYVADNVGHRVIVLDPSGNELREYEGVPVDSYYFNPNAIAVDNERELVYASTSNVIQIFTLDGEQVSENWLAGRYPINYIDDIDADEAGNVYVAQSSSGSILKFSPEGLLVDEIWGTDEGPFHGLGKVGVDGNGDVYATDFYGSTLNKFAFTANRLAGLTSSKGTWNTPFESGTQVYSITLGASDSKFTLTPEAYAEDAQISVNGVVVDSGETSAAISIAAGASKKILIEVTSEDGVKREYTLSVSRSGSGGNNSGPEEAVTEPEAVPPINVVVDGQEDEAAQSLLKDAVVTAGEGGVNVDISEAGVEQLLGSEGAPDSIVLRFDANSNWIDLGLPQSLIQLALTNPNAVIELRTGLGTLKLKLADLLRELDGDVASIRIRLSKETLVPSSNGGAVQPTGASTVRLGLTAVSKSGQSKPIVFKRGYVQFLLPVSNASGNLIGREHMGVALDSSGAVSYPLPTLFGVNQTAVLHLKGDAVFTVIRHTNTFSDGTAAPYAANAIGALSNKFIVNGMTDELFQPLGELNRAQFATLILRALGIQEASSASSQSPSFTDVAAEQWYGEAIATASELGIISGFTDGSFRPNQKVNRQELLTIVYNALKLTGAAVELSDEETTQLLASFTDKDNIAPWAKKAIAYAVKHGIVQGQPNGSFAPTAAANRAQGTVVIYNMLQAAGLLDK
jgi:sugar lactone lactonase YvrE